MKTKYTTGNVTWSKCDMARVIVQALLNMDEPARADSFAVKQQMKRSYDSLAAFMPLAHKALERKQMQSKT